MKLSAHNVLKGVVSIITRESAERLGLAVGSAVQAVIKASDVITAAGSVVQGAERT